MAKLPNNVIKVNFNKTPTSQDDQFAHLQGVLSKIRSLQSELEDIKEVEGKAFNNLIRDINEFLELKDAHYYDLVLQALIAYIPMADLSNLPLDIQNALYTLPISKRAACIEALSSRNITSTSSNIPNLIGAIPLKHIEYPLSNNEYIAYRWNTLTPKEQAYISSKVTTSISNHHILSKHAHKCISLSFNSTVADINQWALNHP